MLRFATSPTGDMHISNLRVAILNYLVARQESEPFLVRIDDINIQDNIIGKDTEIMMILEKFAIKHDLVFHQSEHLNLHQTLAIKLLKEGKAFICRCVNEKSCSKECKNLTQEEQIELKESKTPFVTRIDRDSTTILDREGKPTYTFAVACDDMMSDISHIICPEIDMVDVPIYEQIKILLGYKKETKYSIVSTFDKDYTIQELFEEGFLPDAIINYLLLDENPPKEIFTLPEAIEWFDLKNISKMENKFDIDRLLLINREHLKRIQDKELSKLFGFADEDIGKLAKLYLEEVSTIKELEERIKAIFKPKDFTSKYGTDMKLLSDIIFDSPAFDEFAEFREFTLKRSGLDEERFNKALSCLLTYREDSSNLSNIYPFIKSYILEVAS